jgi:MtfA peptidase
MLFTWLTRRRRARLQSQPFPKGWQEILRENVHCAGSLSEDRTGEWQRRMQVFVAEKNWEGVGGLTLTEEMQVTIAGLACYMVLGMPDQYFDNVLSILVYPTAYVAPDQHVTPAGIVIEGGQARMGEAWYRGPVILSWEDVLESGRGQSHGSNLVFHEFAHQLDMQNGRMIDGTPPLPSRELAERWPVVMEREFQQLQQDCRGFGRPLLDCYGTTNRAEFFAVATETFFCRPAALSTRHAELFEVLKAYYRQDPRRVMSGSTPV